MYGPYAFDDIYTPELGNFIESTNVVFSDWLTTFAPKASSA